jgi:hypothetical protein
MAFFEKLGQAGSSTFHPLQDEVSKSEKCEPLLPLPVNLLQFFVTFLEILA